MEDSPQLYISELGENEDVDEGEEDLDISREEIDMAPHMTMSWYTDLHKHQDTEKDWNSFPCQHCERLFPSKQGLERHMHIHTLANSEAHAQKSNKSNMSFGSNVGQLPHEKMTPQDSGGLVMQLNTSIPTSPDTSTWSAEDPIAQPDKQGVSDGNHSCKYCQKIFNTYTNKRRHERRIHEQHLQLPHTVKPQLPWEEHLQKKFSETSQDTAEPVDITAPAAALESEGEHLEQYMLDVSSNISENLSFYIDGKIVSTSTVSRCEVAEGHSTSSTLIKLDSLILDPGKEIPGQPLVKRRTATPPLLPQIKTELESDVVVSSSSSSLVSALIENILPQTSESTIALKERTVFLSPKLKQLLEKQDGLKPTLALIADGQNPSSPVSLSVLPAGTGKFKRRTGSPPSSPQQNPTPNQDTSILDMAEYEAVRTEHMETQHSSSPAQQTSNEKNETVPSVEEPAIKAVLTDSWPPMTGGNSCNQQPLDLSNTVKTNSDKALADAVLDLSLQKKAPGESGVTLNLASQTDLEERKSNACMADNALINIGEQNVCLGNPDTPLVTDLTVFTGSDMITPLEPVAERLVYGVTLPSSSLTPSPGALTPFALQPASPCTIAFASPASHNMLPTPPSLITVLAPPCMSNPSSQPIQVFGPTLSPDPLVICAENALNSSDLPNPQNVDPTVLVSSIAESVTLSTTTTTTSVVSDCPVVEESRPDPKPVVDVKQTPMKEDEADDCTLSLPKIPSNTSFVKAEEDESSNNTANGAQLQTFKKNFICNVCNKLFHSMKELGDHVGDHADEWPYKCEFCVLLFGKPSDLLDHRSSLHGVGMTYVCSACTKEFVYLCNVKQHQDELHPGQQCTYTEEEKGKLRPQNYNSLKVNTETSMPEPAEELKKLAKKEEGEVDVASEELFTTIKIMASDGSKIKGPDVRLGINQHYPSFKPPPFPYHNRSPAGAVASATKFTTHNIPQTFSTAIRCTKCGKSFDNMPELHNHILACANASDKKRYTPKKNPIPLRHFAKTQNGVLSTTNSHNGLNASNRPSQSNRSKPSQESAANVKLKVLNKRKRKLVQRVMPQKNKSAPSSNRISRAQVYEKQEVFVCPHCSREFTMRRSRTKHMKVCPKKPEEVKKRKEIGISVTKENDGHLHRVGEDKQQASPLHKTRLQTSGSAKRPSILPVQTVFSNKRSKIIIKESMQPKQETATLNELPIVRTFSSSMRQYSRVQHSVKGIPIKVTIVKPQQTPTQKDERELVQLPYVHCSPPGKAYIFSCLSGLDFFFLSTEKWRVGRETSIRLRTHVLA
uniref:C2H2-type domain-containing protein n=1 Tax=Mola mola TaxID=94237 RepID=A0A3Q3WT81_MOLML